MDEYGYIKENVKVVLDRIDAACSVSGRRIEDVSLLAVTKTHGAEEIIALIDAGIKMIGENRVQEAESKKALLTREFEFHFVGHLQTNKADKAAALFDVVQSVDSYKLAEKLSAECIKRGKTMTVFAQVNSSGEGSKSGFSPDEFIDEALKIADAPALDLKGVMTIGPLTNDEEEIREAFILTRGLFQKLQARLPEVQFLSMGMTDDIEMAIAEGSTMLRIGRALFERR